MTELQGRILSDEKILALSWKQPFASMMLYGKIETRGWITKYRGLVLICASKKDYNFDQVYNIAGERQVFRITDILTRINGHYLNNYRSGMAIAIGELIDCRPMKPEDEDACFVKYYDDLYCHIYKNVCPINPFTWKGKQRWTEVTSEQRKSININLNFK